MAKPQFYDELKQLAEIEDALEEVNHYKSYTSIREILMAPSYKDSVKTRFPFFSEQEILDICTNLDGENSYWRLLHPKGNIILRCRTKKILFFVPGVHVTMAWSGRFQFKIGDSSFILEEGDTCICNTHVPYSFEPLSPDGIALDFVMSDDYLSDILMERLPGTSLSNNFFARSLYNNSNTMDYLYIPTHQSSLASDLLARAVLEFTQKSYFADEVVNSYILLLFVEIARVYANNYTITTNAGDRYDVKEIISYIQANLATATVTSVSEYFHFSPSYLSAMLKKASGHSFKYHLHKARMNKACILLKHTDFSVTDIGASIGYKNMNHFYTLFKNTYHCTPGEYREQL